jgi:diketogulonate reductase-like aldo/keto reductase
MIKMIPSYTLKNGVQVPKIGLGTYALDSGGDVPKSIRDAVEAGLYSFDTAWFYKNEKGVGEGIRTCGMNRKQLYVTSKLWGLFHGYEETLNSFEDSLNNLGLDYLDEYLIHWPGQTGSFLPTWKAFEKLYKDGKIRVIGVSNFTKHHLLTLMDNCEIIPMVNQIEVNVTFQPNHAIAFCQEHDIQVEAYRPLSEGKLDNGTIKSIADKYKKSPAQVVIRWLVQKDIRPLPKTSKKSRMLENIDVFDFELTADEIEKIRGLNTWKRLCESPDEFFIKP